MVSSVNKFTTAALVFFTAAAQAVPTYTPPSNSCEKPVLRQEWRNLSVDKRLQYVKAVKCMMSKPAVTPKDVLPGVRSRYDDLVGSHIIRADDVHFVGAFYPYHRLLVHVFEQEMHECGWEGGIPYWDWTLDLGSDYDSEGEADDAYFDSPIFDPKHGFGGNGAWIPGTIDNPEPGLPVNPSEDIPDRSGGGCIPDGPFANLTSHLGPGLSVEDKGVRCIRRDFAPATFRNMSDASIIGDGMEQPDYGWFRNNTERSYHSGGHRGVGGMYGDMSDKWASPADPLFWLHHSNVDRTWWSWQSRDLEARTRDISGPIVAFDYDNEVSRNATLADPIVVGETLEGRALHTIEEVMHIQKGVLCYEYEDLY